VNDSGEQEPPQKSQKEIEEGKRASSVSFFDDFCGGFQIPPYKSHLSFANIGLSA
jgi:hypothetical protein